VRAGLTAVGLAATVLVSQVARAQAQIQLGVSSQKVAVGDSIRVTLTISGSSSAPHVTDAHLPVPSGMTARGPSTGQQTQVSINNGQMSQSVSTTLTWVVSASKPGTFRIGPPSVTVDGQQARGNLIPIEVVPAGAGPARRNPDPFDFFDPFGRGSSLFPPGFNLRSPFDDDQASEPQEPQVPDDMRVDKALDPLAFVRATITPAHVVVGEQVNLRVYFYGSRGPFRELNSNEPSYGDFLAYPNADNNVEWVLMHIGDTRWFAVKGRDIPLFPLRSGTLHAGHMKVGFEGHGYPSSGPNVGLVRESNWADVVVTEPPLRNRPPGYKIGDVGDYKLTATVEPRDIMAGEAVSVVATLSGTGNVPFKILTPEQAGTEWLEPSLTEKVEPSHGVVQGSRTFSYVVKMNEAGNIDLGEVTLPFYDPRRHDYVTARAKLGAINVKPNPNAAKIEKRDKPVDRLSDVLRPRAKLGSWSAPRPPLSDRPNFWWVLMLAPFGVVFTGAALRAGGSLRERLRARSGSLSAQLDGALSEARAAAGRDPRAATSAVERAIFAAIELKLGLKARAVLKTELSSTLTARGVSSERAAALTKLLEDCDSLRFVGEASGVEAKELVQRTAENVARLREEKLAPAS